MPSVPVRFEDRLLTTEEVAAWRTGREQWEKSRAVGIDTEIARVSDLRCPKCGKAPVLRGLVVNETPTADGRTRKITPDADTCCDELRELVERTEAPSAS